MRRKVGKQIPPGVESGSPGVASMVTTHPVGAGAHELGPDFDPGRNPSLISISGQGVCTSAHPSGILHIYICSACEVTLRLSC